VITDPANLSAGEWLETVNYYDDKGRMIQAQSDNYRGGTDISTMRYSFAGELITTYTVHSNPAAGITVRTKMNRLYDHGGRLLSVQETLDDDNSTSRWLARNSYDELGRLKERQLGQRSGSDSTGMELQDYDYNIRGWLRGINMEYSNSTENSRWFGMELNYDAGFGNKQYNGNIAGMQWRSKGDGERRAYGYGYDKANRILFGEFKQYTGSSWNKTAGVDFSVKMGDGADANSAYDGNGNILFMQQKGLKLNVSEVIDDLHYDYLGNSNKLKSVYDAANNPDTKLGDFRTSASSPNIGAANAQGKTDYVYDANGNLVKDLNKDIDTTGADGIEYNHLNLPWKVHVKNKGTITYLYDASGNKLEKQTTEGGNTTRTDYIGGYIYRNDTLQQIAHEEGRIRPKDSSYVYDYFIKDHLGNTRMVLTEEKQQDIYPAATLESTAVSTEQNYYTINTGNIVSQPVSLTDNYQNNNGIPNPGNANAGSNSTVMYKLNAAIGDKMGMGITLRVMSGDTVSILGRSYWHSNGSSVDNNYSIPVNDLLLALTSPGTLITAKGYTYSLLEGLPVTPSALQGWLDNAPSNGSNPKAYVNWILLDEQMKPVSGSSGFDAVGATDELKLHAQTVNIPKNGYLYVYVSNQSDQDVFFDNLQVVHARGPLLEETHYYPFGLTMAGISSKAAGKLENKFKYNGIEFDTTFGLNEYEAHFRDLDPAIGRWWQIDPKIENQEMWSPYSSMADNPILKSDPLGDEPCCKELWEGIKSVAVAVKNEAVDFWNGKGKVYEGVDWVNRNLNPLTDAYQAITGRDFATGESASRLSGLTGVGLTLVGAKAEAAVISAAEKVVAKEFVVGSYSELKAAAKGSGLEAHHVGQAAAMEKAIPEYNRSTAPSILVRKEGHTISGPNGIVKRTTAAASPASARNILARDIKELRRVYNVPNDKLQEVIKMNKEMYLEPFKKK
jgi:RHS repeat-associated protein